MKPAREKRQVLVIDDELNVRESLRLLLSRSYEVSALESAEEALSHLQSSEQELPDIVLLDIMMPGIDGVQMLKTLRADYPKLPVIMLTATNSVRSAVNAMKIGAVDYLNKPFDVDELLGLIDETLTQGPSGRVGASRILTSKSKGRELPEVPGSFGSLVGNHPVMEELYTKINQLAPRSTTVLITGESGTGKELVAREIHKRSNREEGPFIALNCAAIPETLIESELFGHEKGAFTNAFESRLGQFELADGGTLFLDEIGELSLSVQVKMLRFLQDQEFYRVGNSAPIEVDVRIVAATNKCLESAVQDGTFRQDLFYRINVVNISIPPLRERTEDIEELCQFFINRFSALYGGKSISFSQQALSLLSQYSWPGNVRELENVVESILALSQKTVVGEEDLPLRLKKKSGGRDLKEAVLGGHILFEEAEAEFQRDLIEKALKQSNYVQTRAAELLGISRRILKYKMDKLNLSDKPI